MDATSWTWFFIGAVIGAIAGFLLFQTYGAIGGAIFGGAMAIACRAMFGR